MEIDVRKNIGDINVVRFGECGILRMVESGVWTLNYDADYSRAYYIESSEIDNIILALQKLREII